MTSGGGFARGLAQWPAVAAAWLPHAALVGWCFFAYVPAESFPPARRIALGLAVALLLAVEVALLAALSALLETALGRRLRLAGDLARGVLLAGAAALLAASNLKFIATGVHLKRSDLWFAASGFRQIVGEAPPAEAAALLGLPAAAVLLAALVTWALRRCRRRPPEPSPARFLAVLALAAATAAVTLAAWPPLGLFARGFLPEAHWAGRALDGGGARRAAAAPDRAGATHGPPIGAWRPAAGVRPWNVVLVMLESIPWRRTPFGGDRPGVAPHLERLAGESLVFRRAYAASTHSDYAQMAILSSLHPRKYPHHDYYANIEYPRTLLWDVLRRAGWSTSMFSCQNERWGNMIRFLDTPGLEVLRHSLDWPRARRRGSSAESKVYEETPVGEWERWRAAHPAEPFFTYFNFQANHFPYEAPPEAERPYAPFDLDFPATFLKYPRDRVPVMLNRFRNALAYSDRWLGRVIEVLEERGEWQRTLLVVVSDHGEAFYEHGLPTHGTALHEEQVRSLWLMRIPGAEPRAVDEPVALLDVAPTVLAALGLPPHGNFQGRGDVAEPDYSAAGRPILMTLQGLTAEDGVLLDGWKYVVNWDRRSRRLVDLAADPGETVNLVDERPTEAARLDRALQALLARQLGYYEAQGWRAGVYPPGLP